MIEHLNSSIKDIIERFPALQNVLASFNIGCTTCAVGTCKVVDIVEIHNLSELDQEKLFRAMAEIIEPGKPLVMPPIKPPQPQSLGRAMLSPPIRTLMKEHEHILRVIAAIPSLIDMHGINPTKGESAIRHAIDFIRTYADKLHHAKEEDILFGYFDQSSDIIQSMYADHVQGRLYIASLCTALDTVDRSGVEKNLTAYAALLTEHIRKEDEVLYPWMDRKLTDSQIGQLYSRFAEADTAAGAALVKYVAFSQSFL